ncbi:MAG: rhodoquinone biosynthesis methyltransferase RquA [Rhodocyclaceae bacterium]|nr:rhodoquinone biosynthesis methyltransferase RquA [Rhodocyclaceae bacterium]
MPVAADGLPAEVAGKAARRVPDYLSRTYRWAYLDRRMLYWLDRPAVVSAILWGNAGRLMSAAASCFDQGQSVLQAAAVYGDFSRRLAHRLGEDGRLEVVDVAPLQIANLRRKLRGRNNVSARLHDLRLPLSRRYDGICCFFLLHEVPAESRAHIVDNLLAGVGEGGRVVFVDYHRPRRGHPLRLPMRWIFSRFEPFAESLLDQDIAALATRRGDFEWRRTLYFGGMYQLVVATAGPRRAAAGDRESSASR